MSADYPPVSFAFLPRRTRQVAGLTQEKLAERARISRRAVSDLERAIRLRPRKDTFLLLADALLWPARHEQRLNWRHAVRRLSPARRSPARLSSP